MSERFELSFKNKEVIMWFCLAVPALIIGSILIFYGGQDYPYIPLSVLIITYTIFYVWRFFYRRKKNKVVKNSN